MVQGSQMTLSGIPDVFPELENVGNQANHGEVFTRRWVVDLILDQVGYTEDRDLAKLLALEPACGSGAFLVPIVERLVESCRLHGRPIEDAAESLRAFDLVKANVAGARHAVVKALLAHDLGSEIATQLAEGWVEQCDFLLRDHGGQSVDFVVGNPPYVRLEDISEDRSAAYRRTCTTMRGRSDLYVGFLELGLRLLRPDGVLGFIVADRWMRNQYGSRLRSLITAGFSVEAVVQMHDVDAFEDDVSAYPAITVIRRGKQRSTIVANTNSQFDSQSANVFRSWLGGERELPLEDEAIEAAQLDQWSAGSTSWPMGSPAVLQAVADLEARFPPLEDSTTGTRVGIGVATGADRVFITTDPDLVEQERLLPLALAADTASGAIEWSGNFLVNPWEEGQLVDLPDFPRLRAYYEQNKESLCRRNVAKRYRSRWFRTIDRVEPGLRSTSKLLLPDIRDRIHPVLDDGTYYPHHNLYFVSSSEWPMESLGGLLISDFANLLVGAYCVRMRGGYFRFQAQYLRRIRVPSLSSLGSQDLDELAESFALRDIERANAVCARLYGLDLSERVLR